jgi:hypothetical protein
MWLPHWLYEPTNPLHGLFLMMTRRLCSFEHRVRVGAFERPPYAYCVYHSAVLAKQLGYREISVIEFGVAGGNGLLALERYADEASRQVGIDIEVYGFDTGRGLPLPGDYRDLPYHWKPGFFQMDEEELRTRLRNTRLVIGDIQETAAEFFSAYDPAPIAAVMHDLDFYSSTTEALKMFDADERYRIPRIYCYFDDVIGGEVELYNNFTGERLAIEEFNQAHPRKKLSKAYHLICRKRPEEWFHQIFILHDFEHSRYNCFVSAENQQLPLT